MLKEALDRLVQLAEAGLTLKVVDLPKEPANVYGLFCNGKYDLHTAAPPLRNYNVLSLEAVMEWGSWLLPLDNEAGEDDDRVIVWYNRTAVIALNDQDRRNRATYKLVPSEPMLLMQAMKDSEQARTKKHADFVRLLRIKLAGCVDPSFLDRVRNVKFRKSSESTASVKHGQSSIGNKLEAQLDGADLVPEMVTINVPVFENLDLPRESIVCAVDIDAPNEQFTLTPLPGEVERAWRGAEEAIRGRLVELAVEGWSGALCYGEP